MRVMSILEALIAVVMSLSLISCASVPSSGINSTVRAMEAKEPFPGASEENLASDDLLRNALPGTWLYQADTVERIVDNFSADGSFESARVTLTLKGAEEGVLKGAWKIQNSRLIMTVREISNPKLLSSDSRITTSRIVSIKEDEISRIDSDGKNRVFKRKASEDPLLAEYAVKSHLEYFASFVSARSVTQFDKSYEKLPRANSPPRQLISALRSFMAAAFATDRIKETFLEEVKARMSPEEIREVIEYFESPLGKTMMGILKATTKPEAEAERDAFIAALRQNPSPPDRVKLVQEIEKEGKMTESEVTFMLAMQLATAVGSNSLLPPERQVPLTNITEEMQKARPQLLLMMEPLVIARRLYTYQSLSMRELEEYLKIRASALFKKYDEATDAAFLKAMLGGSDRYFKSIRWAIENSRPGKRKQSGA